MPAPTIILRRTPTCTEFFTGRGWSEEYPDAMTYVCVGAAIRHAPTIAQSYQCGFEIWVDYGLHSERQAADISMGGDGTVRLTKGKI